MEVVEVNESLRYIVLVLTNVSCIEYMIIQRSVEHKYTM